MNICCISRTNYWQGVKGGMDLHAKLLGEGLVADGHAVSVISTHREDIPAVMEKNSVTYHHLAGTIFGSRRHGWPKKSISYYLELHDKNPFDLLWSQSFDAFGITSVRIKHKYPPVILRLAGSVVQELKSVRSNILRQLKNPYLLARSVLGLFYSYFITQKPLMSYADGIIVVSQIVADDIGKWFGRGFLEKCVVINNGIDIENFKPNTKYRDEIRQKYGIAHDALLVLSLGRLTYAKGHHLAIQAVEDLKKRGVEIKMIIVGDGPLLGELKQQVDSMGLHKAVFFSGYIENADTVKYYNAADVFVMPTLTLEGLPFVLLEAMACAKPVIASRSGGNLEVIDDNVNGFLIEPGNTDELSNKIASIAGASDLRTRLSESAREKIVKSFSMDRMINRYKDVMEAMSKVRYNCSSRYHINEKF